MMTPKYAHNGFLIAVELDLDGNPTGAYLVIDSTGRVVHVADSFKGAVKWTEKPVDEQIEEPEPPPRPRG